MLGMVYLFIVKYYFVPRESQFKFHEAKKSAKYINLHGKKKNYFHDYELVSQTLELFIQLGLQRYRATAQKHVTHTPHSTTTFTGT